MSWQPHVLPVGVGKQNVLHNPFLIEQLKLTTKKMCNNLDFSGDSIVHYVDHHLYYRILYTFRLKCIKSNVSFAYGKHPTFETMT